MRPPQIHMLNEATGHHTPQRICVAVTMARTLVSATCRMAVGFGTLCIGHAPVWSQEMTDITSAASAASAASVSIPHMLWVYFIALCTALCTGLVWMYRRTQNKFEHLDEPVVLLAREDVLEHNLLKEVPATLTQNTQGTQSSGRLALQVSTQHPLFATSAHGRTKECPSCQRTFASWMAVCPVDTTTLEPIRQKRRIMPMQVKTGTLIDRNRCPKCARRFETSANYCTHDGQRLLRDSEEEAMNAPSIKACRTCGKTLERPDGCNKGCDLVTIDPSKTTARTPTIPLMQCPICRTYGVPGQIHCDKDGILLIPITELHMHIMPALGWGKRQKVCIKCRAQHGPMCSYCSIDGSRLIALN